MQGKSTKPFKYHDHGTMATIGRLDAVAQLPGGITLTGTLGWLAWLGVHLAFLVGFRNRAVVLVTWAYNYLTWDRSARAIIDLPVSGTGSFGVPNRSQPDTAVDGYRSSPAQAEEALVTTCKMLGDLVDDLAGL
jgi:NADH dehydrogenase